jgi:glycerol-3-phosphate dehydrogenase
MLMLGTTDSEYEGDPADCSVTPMEVEQVLSEAALALPPDVVRAGAVRFSFAGLRVLPLGSDTTANAHREHLVQTGRFGMVSIAGGKLTTHRRIALEALHRLPDPRLAGLGLVDIPLPQSSPTLQELADRDTDPDVVTHLTRIYGRDAFTVMGQRRRHRDALERIHPGGPDVWAQVYHAVEKEWATTVEDVIRRRTTVAVRGLASPAVGADVGRVLATATKACHPAPVRLPSLRLVRNPIGV